MKRNGMCPVCYARTLLTPKGGVKKIPVLYNNVPYENGMSATPPMGWSSWNTFEAKINQDVVVEMAEYMKKIGLVDAGYVYMNIDDCWEAKERNMQGELECDYRTFSLGMEELVKKVNAQGMKLGIYSSNGTLTCQDFPASQGYEYIDAYTFARWGVEYWKLDYCHNVPYTQYAPYVAGLSVAKKGEAPEKVLTCKDGKLSGNAHVFKTSFVGKNPYYKNTTLNYHVSGLDAGRGAIEFECYVEEDGEYVLTVITHEVKMYKKYLVAQINDGEVYPIHIPENVRWNEYYTQKLVMLKKGKNKVKLFNPILNKATSDMLQYQYAGKCVKEATKQYALDSGKPEKKIVFSICEWGAGFPHLWGASAGNLWRTTGDISANWKSIAEIYEQNVKLYKYGGIGGWNDPDMLEVGNGKMTYAENEAHFALWCMMAAPLILGNDVRQMSDELLKLVTNKNLIGINQDGLGKQAKRIKEGTVDILAKPLSNNKTAVCVFNKGTEEADYTIDEEALKKERYLCYIRRETALDALTGEALSAEGVLKGKVSGHSVKVFIF